MSISNKPIPYPEHNALRLDWPVGHAMHYGVMINFDDGAGNNNEVKYEVLITRLKPGAEAQPLFKIERISEVYVNEILPDLLADQLAYQAGKVFYPLVIELDANGGFSGVYNQTEILSRWEKAKEQVLNQFEGELVDEYLAKMDVQLKNPDQINIAFLRNDWLINTFFKPIYKIYGANLKKERLYRFPILDNYFTEAYQTQEHLSEKTNDYGGIELHHQGNLIAEMAEAHEIQQPDGQYQAFHVLHPKNKRLITASAQFSLMQAEKKKEVKVVLAIIPDDGKDFDHDFTMDNHYALPATDMVFIDGPAEKSFWKKLFN